MMTTALKQGATLQNDKYRILRVLGQGTFGITYLANTKMKMSGTLGAIDISVKVAIKEFFMRDINSRNDTIVISGTKGGLYDDYKRKFAREAENLSNLKHPNIVKVLEFFEENNTVYYVMEYHEGGSLDEYIHKHNGIPEVEAIGYIRQIGNALSYMHKRKMLHLDLKPGNIMLNSNGEAVLIDFGLSKQYDESGNPESSTSIGGGTPGYAPIEQSNYRAGHDFPVTMDVYALGATFYKMLTGKTPVNASEILNEGFQSYELQKKGVSEHTISCIKQAMQPLKKDRCSSVKDFIDSLVDVTDIHIDTTAEQNNTIVAELTELSDDVDIKPITKKQPGRSKNDKSKESSGSTSKTLWGILILLSPLLFSVGIKYFDDNTASSATDNIVVACGTSNGHEWVDLGLSVKWATCNVGASSPSDYGNYYAWGETTTKSEYTEENSKTYGRNISDISGNSNYDAARANWGSPWRMPTKSEMEELVNKCTWTWTTQSGHNGYKVTSKTNGNSIFLPAAGWRHGTSLSNAGEYGSFWCSTPDGSDTKYAYRLYFDSGCQRVGWSRRDFGQAVRPVCD